MVWCEHTGQDPSKRLLYDGCEHVDAAVRVTAEEVLGSRVTEEDKYTGMGGEQAGNKKRGSLGKHLRP